MIYKFTEVRDTGILQCSGRITHIYRGLRTSDWIQRRQLLSTTV